MRYSFVGLLGLAAVTSNALSIRSHRHTLIRSRTNVAAADKCFNKHQNNCNACGQDPECGICKNTKGVNKCMEGTFHGPDFCTLEDCQKWFYTGCTSGGISPTTCLTTPVMPPPVISKPVKVNVVTKPVKVLPVPPIPPPEDPWSILPGLAREEDQEAKVLEEEAKRLKQQQQVKTPPTQSAFDKRQANVEGMLSTQPIRDELDLDAEKETLQKNRMFEVQWEEDRKKKMEQLIKRQERRDREKMRLQFSTGATGVGDYGDRGPSRKEAQAGKATGGVTGTSDETGGETGATGTTGSETGATGATGSTTGSETGGGATGSATGSETGGGATGMTAGGAYVDSMENADDATQWRRWIRSQVAEDKFDKNMQVVKNFHASVGRETADAYLSRWSIAKREQEGNAFVKDSLSNRETDWQKKLDDDNRHK